MYNDNARVEKFPLGSGIDFLPAPIQLWGLRDVTLFSNNNKVRFDITSVIYHLQSLRTHLISLLAGVESPWVYSMKR